MLENNTPRGPMREITVVPIDSLHEDQENARKGRVDAISESISEFGQHRPLVVQRSTGRIIAGNHTFKAARAMGWTEIGVYYVDDDDKTAIRRAIADNATGDLAGWNMDVLAGLVQEVGEDIPGLTDELLDDINAILEADNPESVPEEEPVYPIVPKFGESYNCVVIFAKDEMEWSFVQTVLELADNAKSYKNNYIGQTLVITAENFAQLWREQGKNKNKTKSKQ